MQMSVYLPCYELANLEMGPMTQRFQNSPEDFDVDISWLSLCKYRLML